MSDGYRCDGCSKCFAGESPMSLESAFTEDFAVKLDEMAKKKQSPVNGDNLKADYCEMCAIKVLATIGKRWSP